MWEVYFIGVCYRGMPHVAQEVGEAGLTWPCAHRRAHRCGHVKWCAEGDDSR
jgi:hypothetical protein